MEAWDRDELYREIWQQPLLKLAPKYGISSLMLGKVCSQAVDPGAWARILGSKGLRQACQSQAAGTGPEAIHRDRQHGLSLGQIAKAHRISRATVHRVLQAHAPPDQQQVA